MSSRVTTYYKSCSLPIVKRFGGRLRFRVPGFGFRVSDFELEAAEAAFVTVVAAVIQPQLPVGPRRISKHTQQAGWSNVELLNVELDARGNIT
jgi:hypothetical protein